MIAWQPSQRVCKDILGCAITFTGAHVSPNGDGAESHAAYDHGVGQPNSRAVNRPMLPTAGRLRSVSATWIGNAQVRCWD